MRKSALSLVIAVSLGLASAVAAQSFGSAVGVALRGSTLGGGIEAATPVMEKLNLRLAVNGAGYSYDTDYAGNDYEFDLKLFTVSALADYHLLGGGFRLSAGAVLNGNGLDAVATPGREQGQLVFEIGDQEYDATNDVTEFVGDIEFASVAPYAGIGWGNMVGEGRKWGVLFDIGVLFQGSPTVTLDVEENLPTAPIDPQTGKSPKETLRDNVAKEEAELEDDISAFNIYPVVGLALTYRFM